MNWSQQKRHTSLTRLPAGRFVVATISLGIGRLGLPDDAIRWLRYSRWLHVVSVTVTYNRLKGFSILLASSRIVRVRARWHAEWARNREMYAHRPCGLLREERRVGSLKEKCIYLHTPPRKVMQLCSTAPLFLVSNYDRRERSSRDKKRSWPFRKGR